MLGRLFVTTTILLSLNLSAHEYYIIKKGETLSDILFEKDIGPIYGPRGNLQAILKLNPKLRNGGNRLLANTKILLPITPKRETKIVRVEPKCQEIPLQPKPIYLERKVSSTAKMEQIEDSEQHFYYQISLLASWKNLSSTDENIYRRSTISALSKTNYGADLLYGMQIDQDLKIYSKLFFEHVEFIEDNSVNLSEKKFLSTEVAFGTAINKKWDVSLAMSDQFFLTSPSSNNAEVKKVTLPKLDVSYLKKFYQYKEAKVEGKISGRMFAPRSTPDISASTGYGACVEVKAQLKNQSFKIGFEDSRLKAKGNSTEVQNVYWMYTWENL